MTIPLILVVAAAENGVIGRENQLLWRIRTDLKRFRELTMAKPMIMGRKTFDSIGKPLPGRETIVLTRDTAFSAPGVHVVHTWNDAVAKGRELAGTMKAEAVAVVGGAEIYKLALPQVEKIYLTEVAAAPEGDAFFPPVDRTIFRETAHTTYPQGPDDEHPFTFIDFERRP